MRRSQNADRGVNRGVAVADGKVFTSGGDDTIIALDQKDGSLLWKANVGGTGSTLAAPIYHDGLVYIGCPAARPACVDSSAHSTRKPARRCGASGWCPDRANPGTTRGKGTRGGDGGAPVWTHPAIDPRSAWSTFTTGNAWPDFDGSVRGGANLFTASIVALDLKTGAYKWHFQEVHHDVWDYDNAVSPVLADIHVSRRDAQSHHRIRARPASLHPRSHERQAAHRHRRTSGATGTAHQDGPDPAVSDRRFVCADLSRSPGAFPDGMKSACIFGTYFDEPVVMAPGTQGGMTWAPMTFNPDTQTHVRSGLDHQLGVHPQRRVLPPGGAPRAGTLTAMDPATNRIVWQKRLKFPIGGGAACSARRAA